MRAYQETTGRRSLASAVMSRKQRVATACSMVDSGYLVAHDVSAQLSVGAGLEILSAIAALNQWSAACFLGIAVAVRVLSTGLVGGRRGRPLRHAGPMARSAIYASGRARRSAGPAQHRGDQRLHPPAGLHLVRLRGLGRPRAEGRSGASASLPGDQHPHGGEPVRSDAPNVA